MQICFAPAISWALVFSPPAPYSAMCFSQQSACNMAAIAARTALTTVQRTDYTARCEEQPAYSGQIPMTAYTITIEPNN